MNTEPAVLVLDLGTSRIKASMIGFDGREIAHTSAEYPTHAPQPGYAEQSTADWWTAAVSAARALWEAGNDPEQVQIISVTGQMHGVVPVDAHGEALGACLTLRDRRAADEAEMFRSQLGIETIYRISGARVDSSSPPAKFLWYRRHTDLWDSIHTFLAPKDWLRGQLTKGEPMTDPIEAAGMVVYDLIGANWSAALADACETPVTKLPAIRAPTDIAGKLTSDAASALGLTAGCPVVVGAADDVEFIGAHLVYPGDCLEHFGSTGSLLLVVDHPVDDPTGTLELYPYLIPGRWILGGSTSNAGAALEWLRAALISNTALTLPPETTAPPLFLPYLAGERAPIWQPDARAAFWGLRLEHRQADLIRAAYEGIAFSLRHLFDSLLDSSGTQPAEIRTAPSTDRAWLALRAAVYQRPLRTVNIYDPTALGAALIGLCTLGIYPDLQQAAAATVQLGETFVSQPTAELAARYAAYRRLSALMLQTL